MPEAFSVSRKQLITVMASLLDANIVPPLE